MAKKIVESPPVEFKLLVDVDSALTWLISRQARGFVSQLANKVAKYDDSKSATSDDLDDLDLAEFGPLRGRPLADHFVWAPTRPPAPICRGPECQSARLQPGRGSATDRRAAGHSSTPADDGRRSRSTWTGRPPPATTGGLQLKVDYVILRYPATNGTAGSEWRYSRLVSSNGSMTSLEASIRTRRLAIEGPWTRADLARLQQLHLYDRQGRPKEATCQADGRGG